MLYEVITTDVDTTAGNLDVVRMKEDVLPGDITVKRNSNDLELSINGTTDKLIIKDYFSVITSYSIHYTKLYDRMMLYCILMLIIGL